MQGYANRAAPSSDEAELVRIEFEDAALNSKLDGRASVTFRIGTLEIVSHGWGIVHKHGRTRAFPPGRRRPDGGWGHALELPADLRIGIENAIISRWDAR